MVLVHLRVVMPAERHQVLVGLITHVVVTQMVKIDLGVRSSASSTDTATPWIRLEVPDLPRPPLVGLHVGVVLSGLPLTRWNKTLALLLGSPFTSFRPSNMRGKDLHRALRPHGFPKFPVSGVAGVTDSDVVLKFLMVHLRPSVLGRR